MYLNPAHSYALLEKYGCYASEACDKCGKLIGPVRFTVYGEPGVWCSPECRDGVTEQAVSLKRGRPRKYKTDRERRRAKTNQQRVYRLRPSVEKTVCILSETQELQA
jgi:hypothetical protein